MAETFDFGENLGYEHVRGDESCVPCWDGYPKPCQNMVQVFFDHPAVKCKGLVHANFGDENYDMDYWLYTKCDVCGESE